MTLYKDHKRYGIKEYIICLYRLNDTYLIGVEICWAELGFVKFELDLLKNSKPKFDL